MTEIATSAALDALVSHVRAGKCVSFLGAGINAGSGGSKFSMIRIRNIRLYSSFTATSTSPDRSLNACPLAPEDLIRTRGGDMVVIANLTVGISFLREGHSFQVVDVIEPPLEPGA